MKKNKKVSLGPVTKALKVAAVGAWFEDTEETWKLGFGRGEIGTLRAIETFKVRASSPPGSPFGSLGIYYGEEPVGFIFLEFLGEQFKTVKLLDFFIAPDSRRVGIGTTALWECLSSLFAGGVFRVECELLSINDAVSFLRGFGFTQEGIKKSAYWMGINSFNLIPLRLLRPEWKKLNARNSE